MENKELIVAILPGWTPTVNDEGDMWGAKRDSDGAKVWFSVGRYGQKKDMWEIRGDFHIKGRKTAYQVGFPGYDKTYPGINFNCTRSPAALEKDIARRFIPEFDLAWADFMGKLEASENYAAKVLEKKQAARLALGLKGEEHPRFKDVDHVNIYNNGTHVDVTCGSDGYTVKFYGVPDEMALSIMARVARYSRRDND